MKGMTVSQVAFFLFVANLYFRNASHSQASICIPGFHGSSMNICVDHDQVSNAFQLFNSMYEL
jgi:hypothetical protein